MRKIQKRNIFQKIFGEKDNTALPNLLTVQMLNSYSSQIHSFDDDIYNDDTIRAIIDTIARHFAKMKVEHRLKNTEQHSQLNKLLSLRPNPEMSSFDFLYKLVTSLELQNNAYVYIKRDSIGNIIALYPVLYSQAELKEDKFNNQYLEFTFARGQKATESIDNIIVLRKHYYKNDFFGESNSRPLRPVINLLFTIREGIINAVKSSAFIRGILKAQGMLQDADIKEKRDSFKDQFLSAQNSGGVVVTDGTSEYTPIESKPVICDDKTMALANKKVYAYFGISENIVNGTYSDTEWQAFYEGILEPLAIMCQQEFTSKIFTQREIDFGNTVAFVADKLAYMNIDSKQKMFECIKELGVANKGTICEIFNLPAPPDPDVYLQSLNYVDRGIVNDYQLKKGGETHNDKTDTTGEKGNQDDSDSGNNAE